MTITYAEHHLQHLKPEKLYPGDVPCRKAVTGGGMSTGNRLFLTRPVKGEDPRVKLWLTPWGVDVQIPICEPEALMASLKEFIRESNLYGEAAG